MPRLFVAWAGRARAITAGELRRNHAVLRDNRNAAGSPPKGRREWWRLDPNVAHKYKPVEPPAVPDPNLRPTRDRIVFGWEAPMSDLEWAVQEHLQREHPEIYMRLVHLALIHGGIIDGEGVDDPPTTAPGPEDKAA